MAATKEAITVATAKEKEQQWQQHMERAAAVAATDEAAREAFTKEAATERCSTCNSKGEGSRRDNSKGGKDNRW